MKTRGYILFLFATICFIACVHKNDAGIAETQDVETQNVASLPTDSTLSAIDSLMWLQPDSALACLLPYFDTCCGDTLHASLDTPLGDSMETHAMRLYNRHYAQILLAELLYKNYYAQTNRAALIEAVDYFDSLVVAAGTRGAYVRKDAPHASAKNIAFLDARAHYINGAGFYENDSAVEACKEYLKALEVMEEHFAEKELVENKARFMAYTYTRITDLFSDFYLHEQAIYFAQRSLSYYQKQDAPSWYFARMLYEIGTQYDIMEELDSANCYYDRAANVLDDTTSLMYRDIVAHKAFLSYKRTQEPEKDLAILHRLAGMATDNDELMSRYLAIGDIYYYEHQFDSAFVYMEIVYENAMYRDSKMLSAERLKEMALAKGDTLLAKEYALTSSSLATMPDQEGNIHSSLTALCLRYDQNKKEAQHRLESKKTISFWVKAFVIVALVVIVMVLLLVKQNKSRVTEHQSHKMQQAALSGRLKKSRQELRELKSQIKQHDHIPTKPEAQALSFEEESVCQMIMERVNGGNFKSQMDCSAYKAYALSKEQISALREAANRHFNQFTTRLSESYPKLTLGDLNYCCLYLLGLTEADIAALMQRAYSTVSDRSRKLKAIFGSTEPLSITLHRFASEEATI